MATRRPKPKPKHRPPQQAAYARVETPIPSGMLNAARVSGGGQATTYSAACNNLEVPLTVFEMTERTHEELAKEVSKSIRHMRMALHKVKNGDPLSNDIQITALELPGIIRIYLHNLTRYIRYTERMLRPIDDEV